MSQVRLRNRKLSSIQYIDTARELYKHTLAYAKKFPKSLMFFMTKDIVDTAREVYKEVVKANSCYPHSTADVEFRFRHLMEAKGLLDSLDGLLSIALEMYDDHLLERTELITLADGKTKEVKKGISEYGWVQWGDYIEKEKNLIKGVLVSDSKLTF